MRVEIPTLPLQMKEGAIIGRLVETARMNGGRVWTELWRWGAQVDRASWAEAGRQVRLSKH